MRSTYFGYEDFEAPSWSDRSGWRAMPGLDVRAQWKNLSVRQRMVLARDYYRMTDTAKAETNDAEALCELNRLRGVLHRLEEHPDYEYDTTLRTKDWCEKAGEGPPPPPGDGWHRNTHLNGGGGVSKEYGEHMAVAHWQRMRPREVDADGVEN